MPTIPDIAQEIDKIEKRVHQLQQSVYAGLTRWQKVQLARHPTGRTRWTTSRLMTTDFIELHGDRTFRDDKAIVGGLARLGDQSVMIIGHQKGRDTKVQPLPELRHAEPRGVPEGPPPDEARGEIPEAGDHAAGHAGRLSGPRSGGAGTGRSHRPESLRDGPAEGSHHRRHHRRGSFGRSARDRDR